MCTLNVQIRNIPKCIIRHKKGGCALIMKWEFIREYMVLFCYIRLLS